MSLTITDQLTLLHDILEEQINGCCGAVSEYEQIKSLIKTMTAEEEIHDEHLQSLLPEMYHYGIQGERVQSIEEHIISNQDSMQARISAIKHINV